VVEFMLRLEKRLAVLGRYDMIEEFNVDSKAECDQLNLAHETKTNKASAHLIKPVLMSVGTHVCPQIELNLLCR